MPTPQAAKTILGDILSVRYTIDPGIDGKITIQTPKPVARSAVGASMRSTDAHQVGSGIAPARAPE